MTARTLNLDTLRLELGEHETRDQGVCLMEAVAWWAGEPHTDQPRCVSPVLADLGVSLNDGFSDDRRQRLKPLIPLLPGTAGDGLDERRGYLAMDWLVRTFAPACLDLAGLAERAAELRGLHRIVDPAAVEAAEPVVRASAVKTRYEQVAVGDAGWNAVDAVASGAAQSAARAVAEGVAGDAVGVVTRAVAWAAKWAAVWDTLQPTMQQLQDSAIDLFSRMIRPDVTAIETRRYAELAIARPLSAIEAGVIRGELAERDIPVDVCFDIDGWVHLWATEPCGTAAEVMALREFALVTDQRLVWHSYAGAAT
jgi:hypothetical protein